jgi:hypothetical protein
MLRQEQEKERKEKEAKQKILEQVITRMNIYLF